MSWRRIAWLGFVALVASWCAALEGWLATEISGAWTPDLALLLVLAVAGSKEFALAAPAALAVGAARAAFGLDASAAVLAAYLGAGLSVLALRVHFDVEGALQRALIALALAAAVGAWLELARAARAGFAGARGGLTGLADLAGLDGALDLALPGVLATAAAAPLLAPFLARAVRARKLLGRRALSGGAA
jgi:hypothetical protein